MVYPTEEFFKKLWSFCESCVIIISSVQPNDSICVYIAK